MAYTYLITGATSDVGAALIRHLLTEAPGEDRTILAQGCLLYTSPSPRD